MSPIFAGNVVNNYPVHWSKFAGAALLFLVSSYMVFALVSLYFIQPAMAATNFNPDKETLGSSLGVNGSTTNLSANDANYRKIQAYPTAFAGNWGTAESAAQSSTNNVAALNKVNLNFTWNTPDGARFYLASAEIADNNTNANRVARLGFSLNNGTSNAGGQTTNGFALTVNTSSYYSVTIPYIDTAAGSGSATTTYARLRYNSTAGNTQGAIQNARITAMAIGTNYKVGTPSGTSTTSNSYVAIDTLTWTPDATQDWLIFGYAETYTSTYRTTQYLRLNIDSTQYQEDRPRVETTNVGNAAVSTFFVEKVTLSGGSSHTLAIDAHTTGGVTLNYANVRLYAIPAYIFQASDYAATNAGTNVNTTTNTDALTLSFTSLATNYLTIGSGGIMSNATTSQVLGRFVNGTTAVGNSIMAPSAVDTTNLSPQQSMGVTKVLAYSAGSQTLRMAVNANLTSATIVQLDDSRILALGLPPVSQYTVQAVYAGNSTATSLGSLKWQTDSSWNVANVAVTMKLFNFNSLTWPSSGDGFFGYTSSSTANTDENTNQTITTNPDNYKSIGSGGTWQVQVTGVVNTTTWFDWAGDWISFEETYLYTPKLKSIQWYDNDVASDPGNTAGSDTAAGDAMAAADTTPTSARVIYNGNKIKLRAAINETAGAGGTDVRFRLQYDTSPGFLTVANVGESGSAAIWKYADCGGTDDVALSNLRLAASTLVGTHNESGSSASTFDPAASNVTEFEFCFQNNGATAKTPYFFRIFYTANSGGSATPNGVVSNDGGFSTILTLTTADTYDLEISTFPATVYYGSTNADTYQYVFDSGTEIIGFWDKRSTGIYSVTADGSDMTSGLNTISKSNISWTSTTAVLTGAYASDKTGMSTVGGNFSGTVTAYDANPATEGKGGFVFNPTIDISGLTGKAAGTYSGSIVVTIV
jgi:hypothetical protein